MGPIWFHAASAGDIRAVAPLIDAVTAARPDQPVYLTTWTDTGRAMAHRLLPHVPLGRPPIDVPPIPGRALSRVGARLVVLEYLELWPAWARACARRGVPMIVVDGRVSHRSLRIRALLRRAASRLALFCAQTTTDAQNACALGVPADRIRVHGNGKYDAIIGRPPTPSERLRRAVGAVDVVLGSLHPDEERPALSALARSGLRALIAPRYPERASRLLRLAARHQINAGRRSDGAARAQWVILDTMGELASAYGLGRVALMGGTFGRRGGQNLVEPAAHGRPVVFGPRHHNINAEVEALRGRGGWQAPDWEAALDCVAARLVNPGPDPRPALAQLRGATARNREAVLALLS